MHTRLQYEDLFLPNGQQMFIFLTAESHFQLDEYLATTSVGLDLPGDGSAQLGESVQNDNDIRIGADSTGAAILVNKPTVAMEMHPKVLQSTAFDAADCITLAVDALRDHSKARKSVMVSPFVPGLSEKLQVLAGKYGLSSWHTYPGKIGDLFTAHRGRAPLSKTQDCVYCMVCSCGLQYIGETNRNLKVRLSEHLLPSSNSTLSNHLFPGLNRVRDPNHQLVAANTLILAREKNMLKRKITESHCVEHKAAKLANTGPSINLPTVWNLCAQGLGRQLENSD